MEEPFTKEEVLKAAKSLKQNKSCGMDNIKAEMIKHAPSSVHQLIADIYNKTAETGEFPEELIAGILTPLQKPGKTKGPPENLRPIILLSVLRKILTIILLSRTWDRLKTKIPPNQAAYQGGRSTTEQVYAIKTICEKAITCSDYNFHLLLLDMSKAFDTVLRDKLLERLETVLCHDELHILSILTNKPTLRVRVDKNEAEPFQTHLGIMQGDCLSAVLFIFYLAECLSEENNLTEDLKFERNKNKNHSYNVDPQYADDTTFGGVGEEGRERLEKIEEKIPKQLAKYNLQSNESKKEKYQIPKPPPDPEPPPTWEELEAHKNDKPLWSDLDYLINFQPPPKIDKTPDWKKCKLLGSCLDTATDIERRKCLTLQSMKNLETMLLSKHLSIKMKMRLFNTFLSSIMLYNSELWTLNNKLEKVIDVFQRKILRKILKFRWPKKISNEKLYHITKTEPWSITIQRRRMKWTGHLLRLPINTPARLSTIEALKPAKKNRGRPPLTWHKLIESDVKKLGFIETEQRESTESIFYKLENLAKDRLVYTERLNRCMPRKERLCASAEEQF